MAVRMSQATWEGDIQNGRGEMRLGGGAFEGMYSFKSRFENGAGTNPEELLAAAHAGCFSMALSGALTKAGFAPTRIDTQAKVHLEKHAEGFQIPRVELMTEAEVPGIDEQEFQHQAETAKITCPVSKLFGSAEISLEAKLVGR